MNKYLLIALLPLILFAEVEMKCVAGKCSSGETTTKKEIPLKETSTPEMKCEAGKCNSAMNNFLM